MENNRSSLIQEIKKDVRQLAHKTYIGVSVLCVYANTDVIVTCIDKSQWKLDSFFFGFDEDIQLTLISLDNESEADGCLEDLTTDCLSDIEKYLKLIKEINNLNIIQL